MTASGRTVAVVPLRDGVSGKSRLATALAPPARRRLVAALARHVVGVLAASVDHVVVVTADEAFTRATLGLDADQRGTSGSARQSELPTRSRSAALIGAVTVVAQPPERPGLNAALDVGRERAAGLGADQVLVVHADLPLLTPDDVAAVLAAGSPADHRGSSGSARQSELPTRSRTAALIVVATDRHGSGTNLLLVPATTRFRFRFGADSRAAHVAEAGRIGLPSAVVQRPGTAADLDTIDDWGELPPDARSWLDGVVGQA